MMKTLHRAFLLLLHLIVVLPNQSFSVDLKCYKGSSTKETCYLVYSGSYSWFGAHATCHSQGLKLALGSPTAPLAAHLEGVWFYNAHRIWYNLDGPAFADRSLLSSGLNSHRLDLSGEGDCFKYSNNKFASVKCKQVLSDVRFGCELREGIDYYSASANEPKCPSDWKLPTYGNVRPALCTLWLLHSQTNNTAKSWDRAKAACIARGGRLFSVRNDLEALWLELFIRGLIYKVEMFVDLHEHLYCIDGWCWANGRRNVSARIPWHTGV